MISPAQLLEGNQARQCMLIVVRYRNYSPHLDSRWIEGAVSDTPQTRLPRLSMAFFSIGLDCGSVHMTEAKLDQPVDN